MFEAAFYINNRQRLAKEMSDNSFYFCHSGSEVESTDDECYAFQPYRNFVYLTGLKIPNALLVISKIASQVTEQLFMHIPTARENMYTGASFDEGQLKKQTGIANIKEETTFDDYISRLMFGNDVQKAYMDMAKWRVFYPSNREWELAQRLKNAYPYLQLANLYPKVCKMRTIKSKEEITAHRKACQITEEAVKNMLKNMKPGMKECQIEAYYDFVLKSYGLKYPGFATIAASGERACTLHYVDNDQITKDGEMILFDLGAQWELYGADVSRTYPVNGTYTPRQKELYNCVLAGLKAALALSKPGQKKNELQLISKRVMAEELIKIGKIKTIEEVDQYYFHGSGHFIGLNTHDVGDDPDTILVEDMVFTLEPGLYFKDEGIGIRIEDTILVTKDGCEVLSAGIPKEIWEIEAFMKGNI